MLFHFKKRNAHLVVGHESRSVGIRARFTTIHPLNNVRAEVIAFGVSQSKSSSVEWSTNNQLI